MSNRHPYTAPDLSLGAFNCPHCHAFSAQSKSGVSFFAFQSQIHPDYLVATTCARCRNFAMWYERGMIYPGVNTAPQPNVDLPEDIKKDYQEARNILAYSPRGAAALLRLALQKLCAALGESGDNINEDIKSLVRKGLMPMVQQSLDAVRVIGNNAVHPGQIDLEDNPEIAAVLFSLINLISEQMITRPKEVEAAYALIPENLRAAIERRDGSTPRPS